VSEQPQAIEPVPVQLTRIEGTVNLIAYQLGDLSKKVDRHEVDITTLKLAQATSTGASTSWKTWLPILAAIAAVAVAVVIPLIAGG